MRFCNVQIWYGKNRTTMIMMITIQIKTLVIAVMIMMVIIVVITMVAMTPMEVKRIL